MNMSKKTVLSSVLLSFLMLGCGSDSASETVDDDTSVEVTPEKIGKITRSGSTQGGGSMTGVGELASYSGAYSPITGTGKKLFAIYMIGSDLERKYESGTSDFNEIVKGYNALSEVEKNKLDIVVAFGGANKDGWKGMRFSTIDQILNDSIDGSYGNEADSSYSYVSQKANMGHASSLELFLTYIKNNYANHETKFMNLWDHGSGYGYFLGNDDYYAASQDNTQHTYDLEETFVKSGLSFDLIGYDTCLNGTMEVAKATKKYSKYLLSSEELEPGHGWNYEDVVKEYAKDQDTEQLGTALVDSFINSTEHKEQDGKTLAIVNLTKYDALQESFSKLADILKSMENDSPIKSVLIETLQKVRGYNQTKAGTSSMDLQHFSELLSTKLPTGSTTAAAAQELISKIKDYVVYSKEDGTRPNSNGVAITKLDLDGFENTYGSAESVSANWLEAMKTYSKLKSDDTSAPQVKEEEADVAVDVSEEEILIREYCDELLEYDAYPIDDCLAEFGLETQSEAQLAAKRSISATPSSLLFKGEREAFIGKSKKSRALETTSLNSVDATVATFEDSDGNLAKVSTLYGNVLDGAFLSTAILDATKRFEGNVTGQYYTPNWNQKWYTTEYESGVETAWIPMMFKERKYDSATSQIVTKYLFEVDYIDSSIDYSTYDAEVQFDYAQIEVTLDANNNLLSHVIKPYTVDMVGDKEVIKFGKTIGEIKVGDQLRFYSKSFDMDTKEIFWNEESDFVKFTQEFNLGVETLEFENEDGTALDYYYLMIAEDINENKVFTTPVKAQK